jgi:hypothetical protein
MRELLLEFAGEEVAAPWKERFARSSEDADESAEPHAA